MEKRAVRRICAAAFLLICGVLLIFLGQFTQNQSELRYLDWTEQWVVHQDGTEEALDPMEIPELGEGEYFQFETTLPQDIDNGDWLIFETAGAEVILYLNGKEIWRSASVQAEETVNLGQAQIPLPGGGGLVMEMRPLSSQLGIFPPLLRLTSDPTDQAGAIAYANYYAIPAGMLAASFLLLTALFLLGLCRGSFHWRLLLLIFASAVLTAGALTDASGTYFLPQGLYTVLSWQGMQILAAAAVLAYLVTSRSKKFWLWLGMATACSAVALLVCFLISRATGGYLSRYLTASLDSLMIGYYDGLLLWFTQWLVAVCTLLSAVSLVQNMVRDQAERRALEVKGQAAMESYQALLEKHRETTVLRHEWKNQLSALELLLRDRDLEGMERKLTELTGALDRSDSGQYTEHKALDTICQQAAAQAGRLGVDFRCRVLVPAGLHVDEGDLCTLLFNLLDNALEGAAAVQPPGQRKVSCQFKYQQGFLAISCENTYDGHLRLNGQGQLLTRKEPAEDHGLGLVQMRAVAEKYNSRINIRYDEEKFTVETALRV